LQKEVLGFSEEKQLQLENNLKSEKIDFFAYSVSNKVYDYKKILEKTPKEVVKEVIELQENKDLEDIAENYIIMYEGILCNYLNEVNSFDPKFKRTSIESAYLSALKKTLEPKYSEMMDKESDEVKAYIIWSLIEYAVDNSILAQENFDASRGDK